LPNMFCSILLLMLLLAVMAGCMMVSVLLMKRGMLSVVRVFRTHNAVGEANAKTFQELGLRPKTLADYFIPGLRDYKKEALRLLIANKIVCQTVDKKVYLIENCPL
jgi:hypothetical protein